MTPKLIVVPALPGTFLKMFPERQTDRRFVKRETLFGNVTPFDTGAVFQVKSYILDKEGGHVTFERQEGTFFAMGGGELVDVRFPYPHAMFEIVDETEAGAIRSHMADRLARAPVRRRWLWRDFAPAPWAPMRA